MIRDATGQTVQVLTSDDLSAATWRLIRWGGGAILTAVVAATLWVSRIELRVEGVERAAASALADSRVESAEMRGLTKKLDSLVVIIGVQSATLSDQSATLRDISRMLR